jgi:very-short-patch-repair endonuclease
MNYENKNEFVIKDITNDINQNSYKKECKDIGKKWIKNCPNCSKIQTYKSIRSFWNAKRLNSICYSCKNFGNNNPFYGKKHTNEHKEKISDVQIKSGSFRYKNKGGNPKKLIKNCKFCKKVYKTIQSNKSVYCCYKCALKDNFGFDYNKKTKPEMYVEKYLKDNNISYKYNYELCGKLYDFYIPTFNLLIEVDGTYWHGKNKSLNELNSIQLKNYQNDKIKNGLAEKHGYNLLRVWEDELENVSKYLDRQKEQYSPSVG